MQARAKEQAREQVKGHIQRVEKVSSTKEKVEVLDKKAYPEKEKEKEEKGQTYEDWKPSLSSLFKVGHGNYLVYFQL